MVGAIQSWREWRSWAVKDPSGAAAYKTFFWLNIASALLSLALATLLWHLLRPRKPVSSGHDATT